MLHRLISMKVVQNGTGGLNGATRCTFQQNLGVPKRHFSMQKAILTFSGKHKRTWLTIGAGASILSVLGFGVWNLKRHPIEAATLDDSSERKLETIHEQQSRSKNNRAPIEDAIKNSRLLIQRLQERIGIPGVVVGVSVNGEQVWKEGFGIADLENRVPCSPDTVIRIASISKPITMTIVAKQLESGLLDLDLPIQNYVPSFPEKTYDGKKVSITMRQLVSHLGGIRHYSKTKEPKKKKLTPASDQAVETKVKRKVEFEQKEYYIKKKYENVLDSLKLFQDDPLLTEPGTEFLYTTHGFTLVSAVVEAVAKEPFTDVLLKMLKDLDMKHTYLDENKPLIYNRARYYIKDKKGEIVNSPYVDCSYKWASGGLLSTVGDLLKFGDAMMYSFQYNDELPSKDSRQKPGYLKPETMSIIWTPVANTECSWDKDGMYAMGWGVVPSKQEYGLCRDQRFYVTHTGGAIGASSVILMLPSKGESGSMPHGVSVAMLVNLRSVGLNKVALEIAKLFEEV